MKVNKNNSVYIIVYATIMVVVVAAVLAVAAMVLGPVQDANMERETKGAILASVGLDPMIARDTTENGYKKYITKIPVMAADGKELELYESKAGGKHLYIIPVKGSGLWGPVWGYVAVEQDWNTISGVVFDHKGETPGLGAEITTPKFTGQFAGKKLFDAGGRLVGITVLKGAGSSRGNDHAVDAISGGTITSRAVENMIRATLEEYLPYIEQQKGEGSPAESEPTTWSTVELTPEVETNNTVEDESK